MGRNYERKKCQIAYHNDEKGECIRPWHGYLNIDLFTLKHGWVGPSHVTGKMVWVLIFVLVSIRSGVPDSDRAQTRNWAVICSRVQYYLGIRVWHLFQYLLMFFGDLIVSAHQPASYDERLSGVHQGDE